MTAGLTYIGDLAIAGTVFADNTKKANLTATAPPGMSRDSNEGYDVGSVWGVKATGEIHICADPTPANAVWIKVGNATIFVQDAEPGSPVKGDGWLDTDAAGTSGTGILSVLEISSDTLLTTSETVVLCDASNGPITVTLPAASGVRGRRYFIKKIDSSANAVTVDGNGGDLVDGGLTAPLTDEDEAITVVSDNSTWHIL